MGFDGFPRGGVEFFRQLAIRQDREWFKAHREDFERLWREPMTALFAELKERLATAFPEVKGAEPKVFRIHRDVRFSKDKSPFNTQISAALPLLGGGTGPEGGTALYCAFGEQVFVAAGRWMMTPVEVKLYRAAVAEASGAGFARAVAALTRKGFAVASHEQLKRAPPGIPPDHPRVELLRHKGFALSFPERPSRSLEDGRALLSGLVKEVKAAGPVLRWVDDVARGKRPRAGLR